MPARRRLVTEDTGPVPGLRTWACLACGHLALGVRQPAQCPRCGGRLEERDE